MTVDHTEGLRRAMLENNEPLHDLARAEQRWTTEELSREFTVRSFCAPFVVVTRKSDGKSGTLEFTHSPRFYFNWREDRP
jgi:hypothetical protein